MLHFKVRCFRQGEWDGKEEREVTASDSGAAAEKVCGEPLVGVGGIKQLRAKVRLVGKQPLSKTSFFEK
jgi:hypothetical protein